MTSGNSLIQTLDEFRHGGVLDSSGRFSLDPLKAREMMERYRLADPTLYLLSLVSSAVSGNAGSIRIRSTRSEFEVIHDGTPPPRETLEDLFTSVLLAKQRNLSHFELAIALQGALALHPRLITVESLDGPQGLRLHLTPKQHKVEVYRNEGEIRRQVRVTIRKSRKFLFWGNKKAAASDETAVLEDSCCYCPIPIAGPDGQLVNRVLRWAPTLALRVLTSDIAPPVIYEPSMTTPVFVEEKGEVPYSALISVGALGFQEPGLTLVVNGVSFAGEFLDFADCPVHAVVNLCTAGLQKDVSQSGLVRNDGYDVLMASLKVEVFRTLELLSESWLELPSHAQKEALPLLDRLAQEWSRDRAWERAAELYNKLLVFRVEQLGAHHEEVLFNFANLSVVIYLLGKVERARAMMTAVASDFRAIGNYEKGAIFFEKAVELYEGQEEGPDFVKLLEEYGVCLKELNRLEELRVVAARIKELDRTWKRPTSCRCCGYLDLLRDQAFELKSRLAFADICPRCGYGEFQLPEAASSVTPSLETWVQSSQSLVAVEGISPLEGEQLTLDL